MPATPTARERWRNWAGNQRAEAEVRPGSVDEVAAVLAQAAADGRRVRPIGSGHPFSGVAVPADLQLSLECLTASTPSGSTAWSRSGRARRCTGSPRGSPGAATR